ncbi:ABC transporter permease [Desulfatitalea alkaliphila]|uniref:ABC transporter permease n=1 Tax=Desulfatitalea alkaliphila TaxID=2929485 RepID=A0AA41R5F8_9BACT|nr:ABC transporter permease [Desulfatitalea alkaliphila]MCJ8501335.1 ABC transporter permease [Desulfatitalea alkaliphila]
MMDILGLAFKNLLRYKRRSLLTGLLITVGVVAVIVFVGLSGAFKEAIVGQITDAVLSHLQVHRRGYMASIDNLPLDRMIPAAAYKRLEGVLQANPAVTAYSPRIKFAAMLSNYAQTTNVRLNGIDPAKETAAVPLLPSRVRHAAEPGRLLQPGEVLLPEVLTRGMEIKTGDTIVLVANNKDGSVNGMTFTVAGEVESLMGPGGRDGYLHIDDAAALLRMETMEISEVAVRVKDFDGLQAIADGLEAALADMKTPRDTPLFELHTWEALSPFYNVVRMIDLMALGIQVILIALVLISVLNVMMMSVYERVREIGTLAAMGTSPGRILSLFVAEGFSLGLVSALVGSALGMGALYVCNLVGVQVAFGRAGQLFTLLPRIAFGEVVLTCLIVLAVSVLASLQPAAKAARLEPVEALRHV